MPINDKGVQTPSGFYTWDEFNGIDVGEQQTLLAQAGASQQDIPGILKNLNTMEQDEYKAWITNQFSGRSDFSMQRYEELLKSGYMTPDQVWNEIKGQVSNASPHEQQVLRQVLSDIAGGTANYLQPKQDWWAAPFSESALGFGDQLQGKSAGDIGSMVTGGKGLGAKPDPAAAPQQQTAPTQTNQAMSPQAMLDYYQNIMKPAFDYYNNMVNGEMAQWGSAINQIKGATKGADVNFATPDLNLYGMLQHMVGINEMQQKEFGPMVSSLSNIMGQNTTIANQVELQGAKYQNLLQSIAQNPQAYSAIINSAGGLSSLLGGLSGTTGTTGLAGIIPQIKPQTPTPQPNTQNPQTQPVYGGTP